jgi:flagellar basal body-associated protein FliL
MAEDIQEQPAEEQAPAKKEKKKDGKMSLPLIIGIIAGVVVLQVVIILVVVNVFFSEPDTGDETAEGSNTEMIEGEPRELSEDEIAEREFFTDDTKKKYMETGKIVTNPRDSYKYVALNVGLMYIPKESVEEEMLADGSDMIMKLQAEIKSRIIMTIGSMTPEELQSNRDILTNILKEELKPIFRERDIYLRKVLISEYIMQ